MNSFLKTFLACFLAVLLFSIMGFFIFIGYLTGLASKTKEKTGAKAVLVVDLAHVYPEMAVQNPLTGFGEDQYDVPAHKCDQTSGRRRSRSLPGSRMGGLQRRRLRGSVRSQRLWPKDLVSQ